MTRLIIFDWDDVITLGSKEGYFQCYHEALCDVDVTLDSLTEKDRILAKWGQPYREELRELLKEHEDLLDKACLSFEEHFFGSTFLSKLTVVPGVVDLLVRLSKKYKLAVATGQHTDMLIGQIIPKFGIPDVFDRIITVHELEDPNLGKPHPYMLNEIMKFVGASPTETVMVGDAKSDVVMAKSAGVSPIVVLTGHLNKKEALELGVDKIIDKVTDLEKILN